MFRVEREGVAAEGEALVHARLLAWRLGRWKLAGVGQLAPEEWAALSEWCAFAGIEVAEGGAGENRVTAFEFALYRFAAAWMTPAEREIAEVLARRADAGDVNAKIEFRQLALRVIADASARETRNGDEG